MKRPVTLKLFNPAGLVREFVPRRLPHGEAGATVPEPRLPLQQPSGLVWKTLLAATAIMVLVECGLFAFSRSLESVVTSQASLITGAVSPADTAATALDLVRKLSPQLAREAEGDSVLARTLVQSFAGRSPLEGLSEFARVRANWAGRLTARDLVGVPAVYAYRQQRGSELAGKLMEKHSRTLSSEQVILDNSLMVGAVLFIRDQGIGGPLRNAKMMSGWTQALCLYAAFWGILLILARWSWAGVQQGVVRSGRAPGSDNPSIWDILSVESVGGLQRTLNELGSIFLPHRLCAEVVTAKAEEPARPVRMIVRERISAVRGVVEEEYELINFLLQLVPKIGFLGTIVGIIGAMIAMPDIVRNVDPILQTDALQRVSDNLGTAFDTTFVALMMNIPLSLAMSGLRMRESAVLTELEEAAIRNLTVLDEMPEDPATIARIG